MAVANKPMPEEADLSIYMDRMEIRPEEIAVALDEHEKTDDRGTRYSYTTDWLTIRYQDIDGLKYHDRVPPFIDLPVLVIDTTNGQQHLLSFRTTDERNCVADIIEKYRIKERDANRSAINYRWTRVGVAIGVAALLISMISLGVTLILRGTS